MSVVTAGATPTQFRNPNRVRAAVAVATYGVILAVVLGVFVAPFAAIAVAALACVAAWRNARSGLFVTHREVVARNLGHSWKVPLREVAEVSLMSTATDPSRRTHVWVISEDGACHQVTCLHGNPLRGEALVAEIRGAVAHARDQASGSTSR